MKPKVKYQGWAIIIIAVVQCLVLQAAVRHEWLDLSYSGRVAMFTLSGIACATFAFLGILHMVINGNANRPVE